MSAPQRLDAVCEVIMGQAPNGHAYNTDGNGWPLIAGAGDFGRDHPAAKKFTTEASKLSACGDIVLGIRATIGAKVTADGTYCLGRGVAALRAKPGLDQRYLWHLLTDVQPALAEKAKGATFKQVNREDIAELAVQVPPLAEQRRIADVLDRADALRAKRRKARELIDDIAQSLFVDMFDDPLANPPRWPTRTLSTVAIFENGDRSASYPSGDDIKTQGVLFLNTRNIANSQLDLSRAQWISETKFSSLTRGKAKPGDLIICLRGSIGACCILDNSVPEAFINAQLMIIRPKENIAADYMHGFLTSRPVQTKLARIGSGVAMPQLTASQLAEFPIPTPPAELQRAYSHRLGALISLRGLLDASVDQLDALFASLQHRAFRGEL